MADESSQPLPTLTPDPQPQPGAQQPPQPSPTVAAPSSQATTQTPQVAPQPTPEQMDAHHTGLLGRAAQFLLGSTNQYSVDPKTGQTVATPVQNQPGQLFKSILAGAILGGAVGSKNTSGNGLQAGFQGAGAVLQKQQADAQAADAQRRGAAQQDFKNGQEIDQVNQAKIYQAAQIAHMHAQDILSNADLDFREQKDIGDFNKAMQGRADILQEAGGRPSPIIIGGQDVNGKPGNWAAIRDAYIKDPKSMAPPTGFHRVNTQSTDMNGLKYNPEKGWADEEGNYVDLADRTTHTFFDVPDTFGQQRFDLSGKDLLATGAIPKGTKVDPNGTYNFSGAEIMGLNAKGLQNQHEDAATDIERKKVQVMATQAHTDAARLAHEVTVENANQFKAAYQIASNRLAGLNDQLRNLGDFGDPATKAAVEKQINDTSTQLQAVGERIFPSLKTPNKPSATTSADDSVTMLNPAGQRVVVPKDRVAVATQNGYKPFGAAVATSVPDPGGPPEQQVMVQLPSGSILTMSRGEYAGRAASQNYQTQQMMKGTKILGPAASEAPPEANPTAQATAQSSLM